VRHLDVAQHREQLGQDPLELGVHARLAVVLRLDRRAVVVRRTASAERDPVVGGPLPVDDQMPEVGEGLTPCQTDLVHTDCGSGSVASISEYTGAMVRLKPPIVAV